MLGEAAVFGFAVGVPIWLLCEEVLHRIGQLTPHAERSAPAAGDTVRRKPSPATT
jgi:hypothetical protein